MIVEIEFWFQFSTRPIVNIERLFSSQRMYLFFRSLVTNFNNENLRTLIFQKKN